MKIWSRAHLKKTPEISIFLCWALVRRTIFFGPVVLDVFLDGASIESIKFTKKSHHGLLKCEKPRKTAFFGHFRPNFTVFWNFFEIGSNDFVQTPCMFRGGYYLYADIPVIAGKIRIFLQLVIKNGPKCHFWSFCSIFGSFY